MEWERGGRTTQYRLRNAVKAYPGAKWPAPRATDGSHGGRVTARKTREGGNLIEAVSARTVWPTPTVNGNTNRKGASASSGDGLRTAVVKWATPTARDWKSGKASQETMERNARPLSEQVGGSLNPEWVELLMGFPKGWTEVAWRPGKKLPRGLAEKYLSEPTVYEDSATQSSPKSRKRSAEG